MERLECEDVLALMIKRKIPHPEALKLIKIAATHQE